jgi:hypothetical protein
MYVLDCVRVCLFVCVGRWGGAGACWCAFVCGAKFPMRADARCTHVRGYVVLAAGVCEHRAFSLFPLSANTPAKNFHKGVSTGLCWFALASAGRVSSLGTDQHKPAQACTNILMEVFAGARHNLD